MAGFHALTLFCPKPVQRALVQLFYELLTAEPDRYVNVNLGTIPDGWASYDTIMFMSCSYQDIMEVYLCRGSHFTQLTSHPAGRYQHYLGYISNYAILRVYHDIFLLGHYIEVVAFAEDYITNGNVSDLYVRVPSVSSDLYAVLWSSHPHTAVYLNSYRHLDHHTMHRMGYRGHGMNGFMYPVIQIHPLSDDGEKARVQHLQAILPPALFEEMFLWASWYNQHVYNRDYVDGTSISYPSEEETATLTAINGTLHGILNPAVYSELARAAEAGPAVLMPMG